MRELIKHIIRENIEEVTEKSLLHCHAVGLHSLMLVEKPEQTIRMFFTTPEHVMWKNTMLDESEKLSIAIHPHHCTVNLLPVCGEIYNVECTVDGKGRELDKFLYRSHILDGEQNFSKTGTERISNSWKRIFEPGIYMKAHQLHTIFVPKGMVSAWVVIEGKEDPNYTSICFSNDDLTKINADNLYIKPTADEVLYHAEQLKLI